MNDVMTEVEETVGIYEINEATKQENLLKTKEEEFRRRHIKGTLVTNYLRCT